MNMKKEDEEAVLQYIKTGFTNVEENLVNDQEVTQMTSFGIRSRKIFTLFINNELIEPFSSYYELCQKEVNEAGEVLDFNHFFGQKTLQETVGAIGESELEEEVGYLNNKGITTVQEYVDLLTSINRRLESAHMKNTLLIYESLTSLAFSKKEEKKAILIKKKEERK